MKFREPDDTNLLSVATLPGSMVTSAEKLLGSLADRISAKISAGEYPPGSRLRQEALAEEFSVSRTPIREALRQLEVKGVI